MMAKVKQILDKLFLRSTIYEARHEVIVLRAEMAKAITKLNALEAESKQLKTQIGFLMQDVPAGHEGLADQMLEFRVETSRALKSIAGRLEQLAPKDPEPSRSRILSPDGSEI